MRTVYLNGEFVPENEANVSIFDRGFLFADGVYEVTTVVDGKLIGFEGHIQRLQRSLDELKIPHKVDRDKMLEIHKEIAERNNVTEGMIYLQITRGNPGDRDFAFPPEDTPVTMVLFTQHKNIVHAKSLETGIKVISIEDLRWGRRDIKTVQLLYPSLAKMEAKSRGADDAWMMQDGFVTEGTSNNAYIVKDGTIITRHLSNDILHGITRKSVLECARMLQMKVEERPFTIEEAYAADEAFVTSASGFANPVVEIDGKAVGTGKPGAVSEKLRGLYLEENMKAAV
ncbi:D-amino-acid transaminase [Ahrensia sp. R2A130]|uniref:D-amino-acid transaminase n=1 Tax=Ahrensia sp. R2A130 TaxID=744979 RepID=UPI0001E09C8E|nr:D-alanine aminotransferase [Ahrensia sp. R2A130]